MTKNLQTQIRSCAIAVSAALAFGWAGAVAAADPVVVDLDGTDANAADATYGSFDWTVSSVLLDSAIPINPFGGTTFNLYTHAVLGSLTDALGDPVGNPSGMNSTWEITVISGFSETATLTGGSVTLINNQGDADATNDVYQLNSTSSLAFNSSGTTNFFAMYYDDVIGDGTKANSLSGLGFDDGTLILSGTISQFTSAGTFASNWYFVDADGDGLYDPGEETGTDISTGNPVNAGRLLDQSSNGDDWGGQLTAYGEGSTSIEVDVTFQDNTFFKSLITALSQDLFFTTRNNLPVDDTNPSKSFDTGTGPGTLSLAGGGISLGNINCVNGPDCILETDASNSFLVTTPVPEPSSLALLGLTLALLGFGRKNKFV